MNKCNKCGTFKLKGYNYCANCGKRLKSNIFIPYNKDYNIVSGEYINYNKIQSREIKE